MSPATRLLGSGNSVMVIGGTGSGVGVGSGARLGAGVSVANAFAAADRVPQPLSRLLSASRRTTSTPNRGRRAAAGVEGRERRVESMRDAPLSDGDRVERASEPVEADGRRVGRISAGLPVRCGSLT